VNDDGNVAITQNADSTYQFVVENTMLRRAVMAIAKECKFDVELDSTINLTDEDRKQLGAIQPNELQRLISEAFDRRVSIFRAAATPRQALIDIARLARLKAIEMPDGSLSIQIDSLTPLLGDTSGGGAPDGDDPDRKDPFSWYVWSGVPEPFLSDITKQVEKVSGEDGKVIVTGTLERFLVYDRTSRLEGTIKPLVEDLISNLVERIKNQPDDPKGEKEVIRRVKAYTLSKDVTGDQFKKDVQELVTDEHGSVSINAENNSVVIVDDERNFPAIDEFMLVYDAFPQQVQITATIAEVTLLENEQFGIDVLSQLSMTHLNDGVLNLSTNGGLGAFGGLTGTVPTSAVFSNSKITGAVEALRATSRIENLSSPTLLVTEGKTGSISVGQEIPYIASVSDNGNGLVGTVAFKDVKVSMEVTPKILENGEIVLNALVSVEEVIDTVTLQNNATPVLSSRTISSEAARVMDGETLVLGGLLSNRERRQTRGVPGLSDIPILGALFGARTKEVNKTDLLFFLTPTIVSADGKPVGRGDKEGMKVVYEKRHQMKNGDEILRRNPGVRESDIHDGGTEARPAHMGPALEDVAEPEPEVDPEPEVPAEGRNAILVNQKFTDRDVEDVLQNLAEQAGVNLTIDGDVDTTVTVYWSEVTAIEAIAAVCDTVGLTLVEEPTRLLVKVPENYKRGTLVIPTDDASEKPESSMILPGEEVVLENRAWVDESLMLMLDEIRAQSNLNVQIEGIDTNDLIISMEWSGETAGETLAALADALELELVREDGAIIMRPAAEEAPEEGIDPEGTQPEGADPAGTQPEGTDPAGTQPEGADPAGAQPEGDPANTPEESTPNE